MGWVVGGRQHKLKSTLKVDCFLCILASFSSFLESEKPGEWDKLVSQIKFKLFNFWPALVGRGSLVINGKFHHHNFFTPSLQTLAYLPDCGKLFLMMAKLFVFQ